MYNNDTCDPSIGPIFTIPRVENVTTENTTFFNNVTITVQVWDKDGIDTVILNDTILYVMKHISGNNYSVTFHPDPGNHEIRFIANDTKGNTNDTVTDSFYVHTAPFITGVNITPDSPQSDDVLNCTPYGWYDPEGDPEAYYYQWYDTGVMVPGAVNSMYDCSSPGCDKGDVIYCEVTPYDSYQNGTSVNGSVVIGNLPPSKPSLSPNTGTFHDTIYINCSGSTDSDGDPITYFIQTKVNGTWQHIVVVVDLSTKDFVFYINGEEKDSTVTTVGTPPSYFYDIRLDERLGKTTPESSGPYFYDGSMDEVRISKTCRSADWVLTQYNNQNEPSSFFSIGPEETSN